MDVVWLAEIKWDYLRTRKQQLIRRRPDDARILYLEPYVRGKPNRYDVREEGERLVLRRGAETAVLSRARLAKLFFGPERVSDFAADLLPLPFWQWPIEFV